MHRKALKTLLAVISLAIYAGCAPSSVDRTGELLSTDYATLSDGDLLAYYYRLGDQIARVERSRGDTRLGVGVGSYPVHVGVSTGIGAPTVAEDLRQRRSEVRLELARRGLQP